MRLQLLNMASNFEKPIWEKLNWKQHPKILILNAPTTFEPELALLRDVHRTNANPFSFRPSALWDRAVRSPPPRGGLWIVDRDSGLFSDELTVLRRCLYGDDRRKPGKNLRP